MAKALDGSFSGLWTCELCGHTGAECTCEHFARWGGGRGPDKTLTDAELAAEYQCSRLVSLVRQRRTQIVPSDTVLFDHYERGVEQEWMLERFATHPNYDEGGTDADK